MIVVVNLKEITSVDPLFLSLNPANVICITEHESLVFVKSCGLVEKQRPTRETGSAEDRLEEGK